MKAVMLAAGVARRLYGEDSNALPKALLEFDGKTLLERHIQLLSKNGVDELVMVVGHRKEDLIEAAEALAPNGFKISFIDNPRYKEGPILSLAAAAPAFESGDSALFMDSDVLYHPLILERLIHCDHQNCFIYDRNYDSNAGVVELRILDGIAVDFGKEITGAYDTIGEWPGFMKYSPDTGAKLAKATHGLVERGDLDCAYEKAMCEVLINEPAGAFGHIDITGLPWIEIDYQEDLDRAEDDIKPRLNQSYRQNGRGWEAC